MLNIEYGSEILQRVLEIQYYHIIKNSYKQLYAKIEDWNNLELV